MHSVYVLRSGSSGRLYIGQSNSLERRLHEHRTGQVTSTKGKGPWEVVGHKGVADRGAGVRLERELKAMKSPRRVLEAAASW